MHRIGSQNHTHSQKPGGQTGFCDVHVTHGLPVQALTGILGRGTHAHAHPGWGQNPVLRLRVGLRSPSSRPVGSPWDGHAPSLLAPSFTSARAHRIFLMPQVLFATCPSTSRRKHPTFKALSWTRWGLLGGLHRLERLTLDLHYICKSPSPEC